MSRMLQHQRFGGPDVLEEFEVAASLGVAAQTTCGAFRRLDLQADDVVVISAAAGGVGSLAVQVAASRGSRERQARCQRAPTSAWRRQRGPRCKRRVMWGNRFTISA